MTFNYVKFFVKIFSSDTNMISQIVKKLVEADLLTSLLKLLKWPFFCLAEYQYFLKASWSSFRSVINASKNQVEIFPILVKLA